MEVQSSKVEGLNYTTSFFNVRKDDFNRVTLYTGKESDPELRVDNRIVKKGSPASATFDGMLTFTYPENKSIVVSRKIYASNRNALFIEEWQLRNGSDKSIKLSVSSARMVKFTNENIDIVSTCKGVEPVSVKLGEMLCNKGHYDSIAGIPLGTPCNGTPVISLS